MLLYSKTVGFAPLSSSQLDPLGGYLVLSLKLVNLQQTQESFYSITPLLLILSRVCFFVETHSSLRCLKGNNLTVV